MKHNIFGLSVVALLAGVVTYADQRPGQAPPPAEPGQPGVTFKAEVNYVEVDARVVDAEGKFVSNLAQRDFEVLEDGKPQQVTIFSLVNLPVERTMRPLFASKPIEPDVQNNLSGTDGRVYLIVLDDLHTNALRSTRVKAAAKQFVERFMGANDMAAVVHTSGRAEASQEFTNNRRLLLGAIDKFIGRKVRSALLGKLEEEQRTRDTRQQGDRIDDPDAFERGYQARNTLDSLKAFADVMSGVRGRRKAMLFFSEGIDYDINDVFNNRDATTIMDSTREAIAAATRANVSIYGIDVRGLGAGLDDNIDIQSFPDDTSLGLNSNALNNEVRLGQDSLRVLADETGGFAHVNTNDINGTFRRVVDESSSYYVLGYYPANDKRDGRFRKITVRVANRPGLTVTARRGYVAPRGKPPETKLAGPTDASSELREAMSSPIPVSSLAMAMTASVFKGPDKNGSVVISTLIGGRDLPLVEKDSVFKNDLEVAFMAVDAKGKVFSGDRNTLNLTLKPDTMQRVRQSGFRVISSMDLPPGRYQIRVAAREANNRRSGSVLSDIEVPDFTKDALTMSSLALTSQGTGLAPTARPKDPLQKLLPAPLTSYRDFTQADEIALFAEVYEAVPGPSHKVEINLTMKAEGGQGVFSTREERDSSELGGGGGGYGFSARIPLKDLAPGLYVLRVDATSRSGDRPTVSRETIVNILPGRTTSAAPASTPAAPAAAAPAGGAPAAPATRTAPPAAAPAAPAVPAAPPAPVAMTPLNSDLMSGIDRPQQIVAKTAAEFQTLWQRHAPGRPAPAVDFTKNMVVAVFLGSRPTGGFAVEITGVQSEGDATVVRWAERKPGAGQMAAQVMTAPSFIATVPRRDGPVRFEKLEP